MEITQGIQYLANEVFPLVAGKITFVRFYGRQLAGPDTPNVVARLIGLQNSTQEPLPGSTLDNGRICVLATDGYSTAIATSEPFTVRSRLPEPVNTSPAAGQFFSAGQAVLRGTGIDAEDGGLDAQALEWQVIGLDGGSGPDAAIACLAPGSHTAILAAVDSINQTVTTTVSFHAAPLAIPHAASPHRTKISCGHTGRNGPVRTPGRRWPWEANR